MSARRPSRCNPGPACIESIPEANAIAPARTDPPTAVKGRSMPTSRLPLLRTALALTLSTAAALAHALDVTPYTAAALSSAQAAGKPVAVHFHAEWCGTCKQQEKAIAQLKGEPGLDVTLLVADYDKEKALRKALKVQSQSTLVVFRGKDERARLGGDTDPARLRAALKAAL